MLLHVAVVGQSCNLGSFKHAKPDIVHQKKSAMKKLLKNTIKSMQGINTQICKISTDA